MCTATVYACTLFKQSCDTYTYTRIIMYMYIHVHTWEHNSTTVPLCAWPKQPTSIMLFCLPQYIMYMYAYILKPYTRCNCVHDMYKVMYIHLLVAYTQCIAARQYMYKKCTLQRGGEGRRERDTHTQRETHSSI